MGFPLDPPITPMLAKLAPELPRGDFRYEPKWDGFRCLAFRAGDEVALYSRNERPLARYFPEIVGALRRVGEPRFVVDGELVLVRDGTADFPALMSRLHPAASRAQRLAAEMPARYVAFDLLAVGTRDLRDEPFIARRAALEQVFTMPLPSLVTLSPVTATRATAAEWLRDARGVIDGVVAKPAHGPYEPGRRSMVKVKHERTADCVAAGMRVDELGDVMSLLLGCWDGDTLVHVGVVTSFHREDRHALGSALREVAVPIARHPWAGGFGVGRSPLGRLKGAAGRWTPEMEPDWIALEPVLVCEVAYNQLDDHRFRHPARFLRWRPDRSPDSCRIEQLDEARAA